MLMWIRALVVFAIVALAMSTIALIVQFIVYAYLESFISYEISASFWLFPYIPENATIMVDFDKYEIRTAIEYFAFLSVMIMWEAAIIIYQFFKMLRKMEDALSKY